jgi:hypothetical protein
MLKLQQHTINVVSEDEKKRRQIRTKLASHEKEVKKLLARRRTVWGTPGNAVSVREGAYIHAKGGGG